MYPKSSVLTTPHHPARQLRPQPNNREPIKINYLGKLAVFRIINATLQGWPHASSNGTKDQLNQPTLGNAASSSSRSTRTQYSPSSTNPCISIDFCVFSNRAR